jgi:hypothetical protein
MTLTLDFVLGPRLRVAKVEFPDEDRYLQILDATQHRRAGELCQAGPVPVLVEFDVSAPPVALKILAGLPFGRASALEILAP